MLLTMQGLRAKYQLSLFDVARLTEQSLSLVTMMDKGLPVSKEVALRVRLRLTLQLDTPLPSSVLHIPVIEDEAHDTGKKDALDTGLFGRKEI